MIITNMKNGFKCIESSQVQYGVHTDSNFGIHEYAIGKADKIAQIYKLKGREINLDHYAQFVDFLVFHASYGTIFKSAISAYRMFTGNYHGDIIKED